jgi:hypothetical protein
MMIIIGDGAHNLGLELEKLRGTRREEGDEVGAVLQ